MRISRGLETESPSVHKTDTYSGGAWQQMVLADGNVRVLAVFFQPLGRTYWHEHSEGQIIVVHGGAGRVATAAGESATLGPGDVVHSPPGERHWHGADERFVFQHTAISLGETIWFDPVTDEEYARGFSAKG